MGNWTASLLGFGLLTLAAIAPAYSQRDLSGSAEIRLALERLNTLGSVLMIAAHPDDENTALLAYFARGRSMRTAYLSLTRGEGGQNLIGPEQGELLGLIRTQELLAARKIDGALQFFTRAIDFGFSKSADETLQKWGREKILGDIVWIIRRFQPDIVILRFSGTPRDGHGQHQSSAILGKEAFVAAADASKYPEQLHQVKPWKATRLLYNVFSFGPEQQRAAEATPGRIEIDAGEFNPVLGKSYAEIAGISRSMHRSQGMGSPERRGPLKNYLVTIAGEAANKDAFEGINTSWTRVPGGAPVAAIFAEALSRFSPEHPEKTIPLLLKARNLVAEINSSWAKLKLHELDETIALCSGLWLDATADRFAAVPGSRLTVTTTALNRSHFPVAWVGGSLEGIPGAPALDPAPAPLAYNAPLTRKLELQVPANQSYSQPFWLAHPKEGASYRIDRQELIGAPDNPPLLAARFELRVDSIQVELTRPVQYRYVDPTLGELVRPLTIVPPVALNLTENVLIFPNGQSHQMDVQIKANQPNLTGEVRLDLDRGWKADPARQSFQLSDANEQTDVSFQVTPPAGAAQDQARAVARVNGTEVSSGMQVVAYPHIPPQTVFPALKVALVPVKVKVLAKNAGYVMGAGDQIPQSLEQLGCHVTLLGPDDLARRDLSQFDAIVTGVRAYNVRPDLRANQHRLLDYVREGGTLIVQYNTTGGMFGRETSALANIGPYPLHISRDRVTVEEAPVTFPRPDHPLLKSPNVITEHDFDGWVQERGLYFADNWDPHYQPILESHDPGERPLPGGMLYARYGKGVYIFSAYAWFRQLPAGVPGAYRMFANMLSAGK